MPLPRKNGANPFAGSVASHQQPAFTAPTQLRQPDPVEAAPAADYRQADPLHVSLQPDVDPQYEPHQGGLSIGVVEEQADVESFTAPIEPLDDEDSYGAATAAALSMPSPGQFSDAMPALGDPMPADPMPAPALSPFDSGPVEEDDSLDSIELPAPSPIPQDDEEEEEPRKTRRSERKHKAERKPREHKKLFGGEKRKTKEAQSQPAIVADPKPATARKAPASKTTDAPVESGGQSTAIALSLVSISAAFGVPALCVSVGALMGRLQFGVMLAGLVVLLLPVIGLLMGLSGLVRKSMKTSTAVVVIALALATLAGFVLLYVSRGAIGTQIMQGVTDAMQAAFSSGSAA